MQKIITYKVTDDDHMVITQLDETFNRLVNFAPELFPEKHKGTGKLPPMSAQRKALNRIVENGEFTVNDYGVIRDYEKLLRQRITDRNQRTDVFPEPQETLLREERNQAIDKLLDVLCDLGTQILSAAP